MFHARVYAQSRFEQDYRLRCDSILNYAVTPAFPRSIFFVLAKYATGKADSSTAVFLDSLLEHPKGEMFWMYPVTGLYFYGKKNLPAAQKNKIWQAFTHYKADSGITENHKLMYYASIFLMSGEDEKDTLKWFNNKTSSYNYKHSGYILKKWMDKAFVSGFAEFNSPHYGGYYLSPLLLLYDFSKDKEIKSHAEILIWRILGDYLLHYRFSLIGGASSRVIDQDIFNKKDAHMAQTMGLFLEDRPVNSNYYTLFFALSSFNFPGVFYTMWKEEQEQDFQVMDAERSMQKINGSEDKVISYLYSDSLYTLGSISDGHNNEIQTRTWSLDWAGKGKNNTLFGLNPYMSKAALAEYFPGNIDTVYKNILKQRPFYTDTNKWIGGSPYENLFQLQNVLLGIYNFPDTLKNNSVSFFISKDIDSVKIENNILYARAGGIYFALRFSATPVISEVQYGKRYRIRGKKPGFVLEVYPASEYKSLGEFIRVIKLETVSFSLENVNYKTSDGIQMQLNANGEKLFNGEAFTLPSDLIYKSPFISVANGIMAIHTKSRKVVFDWNKY